MKKQLLLYLFVLSCLVLGAQENESEASLLTQSIERGSLIYQDFCVTCHLPDGKGVKKVFPPLDNSDFLTTKRTESIRAIKFGQKGEILVNDVVYNSVMVSPGLSDDEIADVMNYILNSWSNSNTKRVSLLEVSKVER